MHRFLPLVGFLVLGSCSRETSISDGLIELPEGVEATSMLGDTLRIPELPDAVRASREAQLTKARAAYDRAPNDADSIIWLGRRTAYLGRYREAVRIFTEGIEKHPNDPRMYRHRGHRYITVRQPEAAVRDLEHAARLVEGQPDEVEPDGLPNALNIPTSTLQSNIWYHLGLAFYLQGDFENARRAYESGMAVSNNDDMLVATSYWYYSTLKRAGADREALGILDRITEDMDIIENGIYQRLLLLFKGQLDESAVIDLDAESDLPLANATAGYGIGMWHAISGRTDDAETVWRRTVAGSQWAGFGFIAAEAELSRMN